MDARTPGTTDATRRCVVKIAGVWIDTASFRWVLSFSSRIPFVLFCLKIGVGPVILMLGDRDILVYVWGVLMDGAFSSR